MVRSMFSGVSGLRSHQVKMDVIGNNIANVNNQGFKASRATFKEMFNQTIRSASTPTANLGGVNAMQVGLGVFTGSVDKVFTTGSTQTTDRVLDLAIEGEGFFAVNQGETTFYTRAGNFYLDAHGFIVTSNGLYLQGINFDLEEQWALANPNPGDAVAQDRSTLIPVAEDDPPHIAEYEDSLAPVPQSDYDGYDPKADGLTKNDFFEANSYLNKIRIPPTMTNLAIGQDGRLSGMTPDGSLIYIGAIPLNTFVNAAGLDQIGDNLYQETKNSGEPMWHRPADGDGAGTLKSGALEMSNVDLSREFTEMIITQRGFQANSRIITVSDTLLEELINLKR